MPKNEIDRLIDQHSEIDLALQVRDLEASVAKLKAEKTTVERKYALARDELSEYKEKEAVAYELANKQFSRRGLKKGKKERGTCTVVACKCDWHAEEKIDPAVINGQNEFNLDICRKRVERSWRKDLDLLNFTRGFSRVNNMVIWLGGDLVNGTIHEELEESNFLSPVYACQYIIDLVLPGVQLLLKEGDLKHIDIVTSHGNHGRSTSRMRHSTGDGHSWEQMVYLEIERLLRNEPKVACKIERGYHNLVDIEGHRVRFHHGHGLRYQGGVGGITIPVNKAIAQWNKSLRPADYDVFGHWHQYLDLWRWTSCGCAVGYNAYAIAIKAEYQPPTQTFLAFHKDRGKVLSLPVFVE